MLADTLFIFTQIMNFPQRDVYKRQPSMRVSHVIKGRIPEAIHKPVNQLLESDKTIYYERMMFCFEIPTIHEDIEGNRPVSYTHLNATITLNGNRASFSSNKKVNPSDWDATRQRVKGTNETAKLINESLLQIKNKIYKKEVELLERGYILTADLLRDAYQDKIDAIQTKTLNQIYQEFLDSLNKVVGKGTSEATYYSYSLSLIHI